MCYDHASSVTLEAAGQAGRFANLGEDRPMDPKPPEQSLRAAWTYIWQHCMLAWVPSVIIWYAVYHTFPGLTEFDVFSSAASALLLGCIFAPYVETQAMRLVLYALALGVGNDRRVALYSAAIWAGLHVQSESWGLHAFWAFYIFSRCYVEQAKRSTRRAIWMTTAIHAGCNLLSYLYTLIEAGVS
jgi:hypothetical protein